MRQSPRWLFLLGLLGLWSSVSAQAPADSADRKGDWALLVVPLVFYTPATDWAFGPAAFLRYETDDDCLGCNASFTRLYGYYTLARQWFVRLDGETWWHQNDYKLRHDFSYAITPFNFYGIGNTSPTSAKEAFSQDRILVRLEGSRRLLANRPLYGGVIFNWQNWRNVTVDPDGLLANTNITGQRGGHVVGMGMLLNYDTRDNVYFPRQGFYTDWFFTRYSKGLGSDFGFSQFRIDARYFVPVGDEATLAWQGFTQWSSGEVPFQMLSVMGSENWFRGIVRGRYLDNNSLTTQLEYRQPLFWRLGMSAFVATGRVGQRVGELVDVTGFRWAYGLGGRFTFDEKEHINARFDVAYSDVDGWNYYFTIREAF